MACCPTCHRPYGDERLGVRLPPLKARLLDLVKQSGDVGVSTTELREDLYRDRERKVSLVTVRMHIQQINELLANTAWRIRTEGQRDVARWHLIRRPLVAKGERFYREKEQQSS